MAKKRGAAGWGRRILALGVLAGVVWFAVQGGEYGTLDLVHQRAATASLQHEIGALQHAVDSLTVWKRAVETDPVVQERVVREEFGMLRGNKELLYRFAAPPDTARKKPPIR